MGACQGEQSTQAWLPLILADNFTLLLLDSSFKKFLSWAMPPRLDTDPRRPWAGLRASFWGPLRIYLQLATIS